MLESKAFRVIFFSFFLVVNSSVWKRDQRKNVIDIILAVQEPRCPGIVVVLENSFEVEIEKDTMGNDFIIDFLVTEYSHPSILINSDNGSIPNFNKDSSFKNSNKKESVCYNVLLLADQTFKLHSLYLQILNIYIINVAIFVLTKEKPEKMKALLQGVQNENVIGITELPGWRLQTHVWAVDNKIHSLNLDFTGTLKKMDIFKYKAKLNGRHLKIAAINNPPFVLYEEKLSIVDGIEPSLMKIMAKEMGFTYTYIPTPSNQLWGDIFELAVGEFNFTGMLGMLVRKEVDVAIGNFYLTYKRAAYIDYTAVYKISHESFLVPAPRPYAKWTALFYSFTWPTWLATIGSAFVVIVMLRLVAFRTQKDVAFADFGLCFLFIIGNLSNMQVQPQIIIASANRMFLIWWLFGTLILTTGYRSGLISFMTFPFTPPAIDTLQQLVESPLKKMILTNFTKPILMGSTDPLLQELGKQIVVHDNLTSMFLMLKTGSWAIESDVENLLYTAAIMYPTTTAGPQVHLVKDTIIPSCVAFGLQKMSPLKPYFDQEIQRLVEVGLIEYHKSKFAKKLDKWNPKNASHLISFSLDNLQGAFYFFFIGLAFSAMVFFLEIDNFRRRNCHVLCY